MRRLALLLIAAAAAAALAAGCRSQHEAAGTAHPAAEAPAAATMQPPRYTCNFTAEVAGTGIGGQLRMQPDSIIWGCATKVVELGRVRLTRDSVVVYARIMGGCFRGTYADVARRFGWRTNFEEVAALLQSDDAAAQLSAIARQFGAEAGFSLTPWKEAEGVTFPFAVPAHVRPL